MFDRVLTFFDETKRAFAKTDCGIVEFVKGEGSGVGVHPFDFQVTRVGFCDFEHFFAQVEPSHVVAPLGEFDAVASGSAADVEDGCSGFERVEREEEVDFGDGVLGERVLFVGCRLAVEEVSPHRTHCVKGTRDGARAKRVEVRTFWRHDACVPSNRAKLEMWWFAER